MKNLFENIYYWFLYRFHPDHKYNQVKLDLPYAYHEFDLRLKEAIWVLVRDFVEKEIEFDFHPIYYFEKGKWKKTFEGFEEDFLEQEKERAKQWHDAYVELREAYNWFKTARHVNDNDEESLAKITTKHIQNIVKNRGFYWTT